MKITKISVENFRLLDSISINIENDITLIIGKNNSGKTSLFEVINLFFDNKNKIYFSDFYLENKNLIIEIKSSYTFNVDLKKNLAKQNACIEQGYNFIFIIDKNYDELIVLCL